MLGHRKFVYSVSQFCSQGNYEQSPKNHPECMEPVFMCSERSLRDKLETPGRKDMIYNAIFGRS